MAQAFPEEGDSAAAMEGTAAHWVFERMLDGHNVCEGITAPNGVEVTEEMIDGAEMFCDTVGGRKHGGHVERRVSMGTLVHPENWGTPDFFGLREGVLRIVDYKFGHRYVEEFENWQCIDYAAGIAEFLDIRPELGTGVEITIVQPRHFGRSGCVRTWSTDIVALQPYFAQLRAAAHAAMEPQPSCTTGPQCQFCPGRHVCETLQRETLSAVASSHTSLPLHLTEVAAARELRAIDNAIALLQSRSTGLTESLLRTIRSGGVVPGYAIEQAEGRQKWTRPVAEVIALGQLMGIKLDKPGVITPKQAVKAGLPEKTVKGISEVPLGEWKLVRVDTKQARKVFNQGATQ